MTLFRQHVRAQLPGLLIWLAVTILLMLTVTRAAEGMLAGDLISDYMQRLPAALQAVFGVAAELSPVDAYLSIQATKVSGLLLALYAVLQALGIVNREIDRRTVDFLLALPVLRQQVVLARFGVLVFNTAALALTVWTVVRIDMSFLGMQASWGSFGLVVASEALLAMALGACTLLGSIWLDDYSLGVKLSLGIVVGAYFLEMVLKALEVSRGWRALSPFSYAAANEIMRRGAPLWWEVLGLGALTLTALWLSVRAFDRKQIAA